MLAVIGGLSLVLIAIVVLFGEPVDEATTDSTATATPAPTATATPAPTATATAESTPDS